MTPLASAVIACSRCAHTQKSKATPKDQLRLPHGWKRTSERRARLPGVLEESLPVKGADFSDCRALERDLERAE